MKLPEGNLDVVAIGETLVDFISEEETDTLRDATTFRKYLGGSPANIVTNVAKLGCRSAIISKTGIGNFGQFLKAELQRYGVNTDFMIMDHRVHTSFVFIARTSGTPDFEASRNGDYKLEPHEVSSKAIGNARVVHASTFALSREPCRSAVQHAFRLAREQGKIISFDPNYSPAIWPDHREALRVLRDTLAMADLTKPSLDDAHRIWGDRSKPEDYIERFHEMGPPIVVFTMGSAGILLSQGGVITHVPARPVRVVDVTGAGDSFWAAFLVALLDANSLERCALFAREIVEIKLTTVGPLPANLDRRSVYAELESG
jgi:sugar/nucleoside kinase (ribokinase family)